MSGTIIVTITATRGSAPREKGASMQIREADQDGSIGGGALEWEATRLARDMLRNGAEELTHSFPLGPDLGQCCGGAVTLHFKRGATLATYTAPPLWIWGAGHVGRALAGVMAPFADRTITLVDVAQDRFPNDLPASVDPIVAADPLRLVSRAQAAADHVVLTYSHDLDLALCDALLRQQTGWIGLIGSATKWARFQKRLGALGHTGAEIGRISCPIGDPSLGKHPQAIAIGTALAIVGRSVDS